MTFSQRFQMTESDSEDEDLPGVPDANPFDDVFMDGDAFFNTAGQPIMFTAGETTDRPHTELWNGMDALELHDHAVLGKMSKSVEDMFGDSKEDSTISAVIAAMDAMGLDNEEEEGEQSTREEDAEWAPHGCKTMFFLDLLDNLPRLRLSDDHMKAIIWAMKDIRKIQIAKLCTINVINRIVHKHAQFCWNVNNRRSQLSIMQDCVPFQLNKAQFPQLSL
ncbi:uncharacterized protein LACBIDRAFT_302463 [Laccaria bicolor S238N-H82]|uniref:Predicted protein n=1 Tax=Laccaria bicolor (strain S238N-H82 / ATCC MYA-4686) TaxID=486041 RepID=B0DHP6_LACBS|nr:uncharacterized protein LACBIDRAFT_302463 [Laccaria bicolor S238N-H82]EDR05873.1 predicted protein [Laccaria bicolor S238N-H82]|eukprot:XP_001883549.1 predicted protein [Laccaria bicolor S238N-H82]